MPRSICIYRKHRRNVRRDFPQIAIELHLHVPCFSNTHSIPGLEVCDFRENTRPLPCFANKSIEVGGIKKLLKGDFLSPHTGNWPSRRGESERIKNRIYSYRHVSKLRHPLFLPLFLSLSLVSIYIYIEIHVVLGIWFRRCCRYPFEARKWLRAVRDNRIDSLTLLWNTRDKKWCKRKKTRERERQGNREGESEGEKIAECRGWLIIFSRLSVLAESRVLYIYIYITGVRYYSSHSILSRKGVKDVIIINVIDAW